LRTKQHCKEAASSPTPGGSQSLPVTINVKGEYLNLKHFWQIWKIQNTNKIGLVNPEFFLIIVW
jgi:hypothetical protein